MRDLEPPFQFDMIALIVRARRFVNDRVASATIKLPFVSFTIKPDATEKKVAKEIVIRLADRRVLNSFECCDSCIRNAISSLQEIRAILLDKQVELANMTDGVLYLLIEFMLEAIRQFFTFEEKLNIQEDASPHLSQYRRPETREQYFAALEMLRAHLHRCLLQVSTIADMKIPKISENMRYDDSWQIGAYIKPTFGV